MNLIVLLMSLLSTAVCHGEEKQQPKAAKAQAALPAGVPAGATEVEPNQWRHVDANGKAWLYFRNPFGVSKISEEEHKKYASAPAGTAAQPAIRVEAVSGETVKFSRLGPFGTYRWERKSSELTEDEREALEKSGKKPLQEPGAGERRAAGKK
jgi:hypothetical protein